MSKKVTFTLDKDIVEKMPKDMKIDEAMVNNAIQRYLLDQQEDRLSDDALVFESKMKMLADENARIEQEKKALEIDNACLKQQTKSLQTRIDDLAELYPSASVLLGKKPPEKTLRKPLLKTKIFKK